VRFDQGFIRRVMRTTAFVAIVLAGIAYPRFGERVTLGLLRGAALAIASLASIDWMVRRLVRPGGPSRRVAMTFLYLKIPILGAVLWLIVSAARGSVPVLGGVIAGVTLVPVVMVLKVAGIWLVSAPGRARRGNDAS